MLTPNPLLFLGAFLIAATAFLHASLVQVMTHEQAKPAPPELPPRDDGAGNRPRNQPMINARQNALQRQLALAGFSHPDAARNFYAFKLAGAVLGIALGLLMIQFLPWLRDLPRLTQYAIVLFCLLPGFYLPTMIIDRRATAYRKRIGLALPDALDFMLICVEAGQSADVAILRSAEELAPVHPELAARFAALTEALAAGASRQDAYMRLATDSGNDDLRQFGSIIVQSGSMGTPIGQTLRVFSADLRDRRLRQVEERANILPTKMTLGTMVFTIPPLLILLLTPALFRIMQSF